MVQTTHNVPQMTKVTTGLQKVMPTATRQHGNPSQLYDATPS
jgi:hypothetical protein